VPMRLRGTEVKRTHPIPPRTGWPPGLLQDDCKKLSRWFASRIDARWVVRMVFGNQQPFYLTTVSD
jgi:hypothetical protein